MTREYIENMSPREIPEVCNEYDIWSFIYEYCDLIDYDQLQERYDEDAVELVREDGWYEAIRVMENWYIGDAYRNSYFYNADCEWYQYEFEEADIDNLISYMIDRGCIFDDDDETDSETLESDEDAVLAYENTLDKLKEVADIEISFQVI